MENFLKFTGHLGFQQIPRLKKLSSSLECQPTTHERTTHFIIVSFRCSIVFERLFTFSASRADRLIFKYFICLFFSLFLVLLRGVRRSVKKWLASDTWETYDGVAEYGVACRVTTRWGKIRRPWFFCGMAYLFWLWTPISTIFGTKTKT